MKRTSPSSIRVALLFSQLPRVAIARLLAPFAVAFAVSPAMAAIIGISRPPNSDDWPDSSSCLIDQVWQVQVPPYPLDINRGIGLIVNPEVTAHTWREFTMHDHVYVQPHAPDPDRAVVVYVFDTPTVVGGLGVIQHGNGVTAVEGFAGEGLDSLTSIGTASLASGRFDEGQETVFTFSELRSAPFFQFVVRRTHDPAGYALYRAFPLDETGARIPPAQFPTADTAPVISSQPSGQTNHVGDSILLTVWAFGSPPLAHQWRKDGVNLSNATNTTLALTNVSLAITGDYTVEVSNEFGSVTSDVARVAVLERTWPYFADFEGLVGPEWSKRRTELTPVGNRGFLGRFGTETVTLRLNGLPPHQEVMLSFDLFIIETWDGNHSWAGPDTWDLSVAGGPNLLHTSFLINPWDPPETQAFPGSFPGDAYPARTGAIENNTLGYANVGDAVYHLTFHVPHNGPSIEFSFTGEALEGPGNESWGLDNVRIELTPPPGTPYIGTELSPVRTIAAPGQGPVHSVATSGTRALVAAGDAAVALLDLKDPANPVWLGSWEPLFPPSAFALAGNTAYIASCELDFLSTVEIVDFTDPAKPVLKGYYDTDGYALDLAVVGNRLYVADDEAGLAIVDLGNPARPSRIGGYSTKRSFQRVEVSGRYAYVVDGEWLLILDVSDPGFPFRVGLYDLGGPVKALQVNWQTAYVLVGTGELRILDVSDPGNVRLVGTHRTWGVQSMAVSGKYAYLAKGNRGLEVVDLSDPTKPVWATGLSVAGSAEDVAVLGQNVVVAGGPQGLSVYRLEHEIYPPLASPVIADGTLTLSWPAMEGVRLQMTTNLVTSPWVEVSGADTTNHVRLPMTGAKAFFRLAKGPKQGEAPPGIVAWWRGEGDARDSVGDSHGELRGEVAFDSGVVGQAFRFDGGGYVQAPAVGFPVGDAPRTIEGWFRAEPDTQLTLFGYGGVSGLLGSEFMLGNVGSTSLNFIGWDSDLHGSAYVSDGRWHHAAATYDGSTLRLYSDGALDASAAMVLNTHLTINTYLQIGARFTDGPFHFLGLIDEVRLHNRALADAEILAIYDTGSAGLAKPSR